jgi:hypothetical protein
MDIYMAVAFIAVLIVVTGIALHTRHNVKVEEPPNHNHHVSEIEDEDAA